MITIISIQLKAPIIKYIDYLLFKREIKIDAMTEEPLMKLTIFLRLYPPILKSVNG